MKSNRSVYQWIAISFLALLFVGIYLVFLLQDKNQKKDILLIWGQVAPNLEENWVDCRLWLFEPVAQKYSLPIIQEDSWCGYEVVHVKGKDRLREITPDGQIILYNITSEQTIEVWQQFDLNGQYVGSPPQWGEDGSIYFSALENGQEQIYRFDSQSGKTTSFILIEEGLAVDPIISPDGKYLVYWTLEGPTNRFPTVCGLGCAGYYHIYNLQTQTDIELFPLLEPLLEEPFLPHCVAQWAPTGRYLAFNIGGCGDWSAQELVVFDAHENQIVTLFELAAEDRYFEFIGWLSNTEIVYSRGRVSPELGFTMPDYWVFSLEQQGLRELVEVPRDLGVPLILRDLDWTLDGRFIIGALKTTSPQSLMIVEASQDNSGIEFLSFEDEFSDRLQWLPFQEPQLSLSGDWIAYFSSYRPSEQDSIYVANNIYVLNRANQDVIPINTPNIVVNLHYAWVEGQ
jgi:hypothetical protein